MYSMQERLQRLEDIELIRMLKMEYARATDRQDTEAIVRLFHDTAVWDGGELYGRHEGRDAIRAYFTQIWETLTFAMHFVTNGQIEVDNSGQEASGRWHLWAPSTVSGGAVWIAGSYDDEYRKVEGSWLFSKVQLTVEFHSSFDSGWVQARMG